MSDPGGTELIPAQTPITILAEGCFGQSVSKLALGILRFGHWPVTSVIDSTQAGKTVGQVVPWLNTQACQDIPVVTSIDAALNSQSQPKALVLGTAPIGGGLPAEWRQTLITAIQNGLHVISGLHWFLNEDAELAALAKTHRVILWDVRNPDYTKKSTQPERWWPIARHLPRPANTRVVTMVGSDCSVGKMFSALALTEALNQRDEEAAFVATGQTGILISGKGVPLDRVIGDYMAGYMESTVCQRITETQARWIVVEGQGSLLHPAYSGVTLSLLHGSRPDAMILCHNPSVQTIKGGYQTLIPSLSELVQTYETAARWTTAYLSDSAPTQARPKVMGISLNCSAFSKAETEKIIKVAEAETGLPATDPIQFGCDKLVSALRNL